MVSMLTVFDTRLTNETMLDNKLTNMINATSSTEALRSWW